MYKRIMAAVDDSPATSKVLNSSIELAKLCNARLAVCHAIDVTLLAHGEASIMLSNSIGEVQANLRDSAYEFLDKAVARVRESGLEPEVMVVDSEHDDEAEILAKAAADWQADLLIVGASGRRGVGGFFVGSVAEKLVRRAAMSQLLVRG